MEKYKVSACLITKDENRYLAEWLEWHIGQGIEHFYIYDNGSAVPVSRSIPAEYADRVTVTDFPTAIRNPQLEAYADCLERFGGHSRWMAFIDTDEFIRVADGTPLPDFLEGYPEADAVLAKWVVYNANGLLEDDGRPVRERFTQTCRFPENMPQCKSVVRMGRAFTMGAHAPIATQCSLWVVNEDHERVRRGGGELPGEKLVVDHYFTRSYAEWREKMARGSCFPECVREEDWFLRLNPELAEAVAAYQEGGNDEG